jgi:CMP-N,N'-diacetyllegionaminic acid synthase
MNTLAFIPARGGSKGILGKNLVPLNGKPLIQYTVEAAMQSRLVTDIFLSSDDQKIIDFVKSLGIDVSYIRPASLARDDSSMVDTVVDGIKWLREEKGMIYDSVLLLQPTSPLRTSRHIDEIVELFCRENVESIVAIHKMLEHPYECIKMGNSKWEFLAKSSTNADRRQDYDEDFYFINGALYLCKTDFILRRKVFLIEGETALYIMSPSAGIDVDNIFDLKRAEFYLSLREKNVEVI